jgi:catechol 2,3-dioxygenase-like lactoylglutathione lyase family enzyme
MDSLFDGRRPFSRHRDHRCEPSGADAIWLSFIKTSYTRNINELVDILGFHLTSRDYVARFDIDGVLFELVPNPAGNALPGNGNARLSLGVTDIREATRELESRGVATSPIKSEHGGLLSYFKDPDGNELCLWQYA